MKNINSRFIFIIVNIIIAMFNSNSFAQDNNDINKVKSNKDYKVWLYSDKGQLGNGDLLKALDDSIVLSKHNKMSLKSYAVEDIKEMKLRSKSKLAGGIILGSITGFAIGWIAGYTQGDDKPEVGKLNIFQYTKKEKGVFFGITGIIPGVIIGGLIGSVKLKIPINSNKSKYHTAQDKLKSISKGK